MTTLVRFLVAVCTISLFSLTGQQTQLTLTNDPLTGIWASQVTLDYVAHGEITVVRDGLNWRANVAGVESRSRVTGKDVHLAFPGNVGRFQGELNVKANTIEGYWVQPTGTNQDPRDPGGLGQSFATPIVLRPTGAKVWRGWLNPLQNRLTLYLRIFPGADDTLLGAFRNPERNSNGGSTQFRVSREGNSISFSARPDPEAGELRLKATLVSSDKLNMFWPDLGRNLELTRRTPDEAPAFFPRAPGETEYVYKRPPVTGDGWETARAGEVGMDESLLTHLVQRLIDSDPSQRRPTLIHSILVARRGKLVLEEYFFGFNRETPHDLRSAGKTFASIMLGAAMMKGAKLAPETPVYRLLSAMGPFANYDPRKSQITLAHLMTHMSGLACDDNDDGSPGSEDRTQRQTLQPNWWKYTLDLPVAHDPGTRYAYCSAGMNLVGAALTIATRTWLPRFFDRTIAGPLQFGTHYWNLMPNQEGYLGGGAYVLPRDLLKVGQAYLDGGVWHRRRIVQASWVERSTTAKVHISPTTTGLTPNQFSNFYGEADDGYAWHLSQFRVGERTYREYAATGNGGQLLIVVPDFDLVVVFTAGNYGQGGIWTRYRSEILPREIIPAIVR